MVSEPGWAPNCWKLRHRELYSYATPAVSGAAAPIRPLRPWALFPCLSGSPSSLGLAVAAGGSPSPGSPFVVAVVITVDPLLLHVPFTWQMENTRLLGASGTAAEENR